MNKQEQAIELVRGGNNTFITGSAGVGKTYVTHQITTPNTLVAAPTGVAALNAGGTTCHKAFSLPIGIVTQEDKNKIPGKMYDLFGTNSPIDKIILDEIGMLRVDYFELINYKLQKIRRNKEPFGGLQVVGVGDFFQLEPIVSYQEQQLFYNSHNNPYCFSSQSWNFNTIELDKVYRQEDERQIKILNSIRTGDKWSRLAIQRINEECAVYENTEDTLHLCCYRKDADHINNEWYGKIKGKEYTYYAQIEGYDKWSDSPVEHTLKLKEGSRVLICANSPDGEYVNGDRGTVSKLYPTHVEVELNNGRLVRVSPFGWSKYDYDSYRGKVEKRISSVFNQIPIRLAYAMTIHKVQGLTLDKAAIHSGKGMFGRGQLYVALSRIKDIRNMSFVNPIHSDDLIVSKEVKKFYAGIGE